MANALNVLIILFACLGSWTWGYNAGIIATTLGQPSFSAAMKFTAANTASLQGAANALFSVGGIFGCIGSTILNERKGRLMAIGGGCILTAIGAALSAGSVHIAMFIVARFIVGLGVGNLLVLIPLYQSEIAPHDQRGLLVGMHGVALCVGYVSANWIGYGFFFVANERVNWRIPLAIGGVPCLILATWVLKLPQSPRYLVSIGRTDAALEVCKRLHHNTKNPDSDIYLAEHRQIVEQYELDKESPTSWASMFTVPHYRKRCIIGFLTTFFVQCSGNLVITNYTPILYARLGYDSSKQLLLTGAWETMSPFGNFINALLLDRWGRRVLLSGGLAVHTLTLIAETVATARFQKTGSKTSSLVAVAFLFLEMAAFCTTQDASSYVYLSEIMPSHIRAKGVAISTCGLFVCTLIFVSAAPKGFDKLQYGYYIILIICSAIGFTTEWFFWPETRGLTLEEIAGKFGDRTARSLRQTAEDPTTYESYDERKAEDTLSHTENAH